MGRLQSAEGLWQGFALTELPNRRAKKVRLWACDIPTMGTKAKVDGTIHHIDDSSISVNAPWTRACVGQTRQASPHEKQPHDMTGDANCNEESMTSRGIDTMCVMKRV
jgi:hypothetical protein